MQLMWVLSEWVASYNCCGCCFCWMSSSSSWCVCVCVFCGIVEWAAAAAGVCVLWDCWMSSSWCVFCGFVGWADDVHGCCGIATLINCCRLLWDCWMNRGFGSCGIVVWALTATINSCCIECLCSVSTYYWSGDGCQESSCYSLPLRLCPTAGFPCCCMHAGQSLRSSIVLSTGKHQCLVVFSSHQYSGVFRIS